MQKPILGVAALFTLSQAITFAQTVPKQAIDITNADVQAVAKAGAARTPPAVDQQLRIVDLVKYNLAVGIVHRGATGGAAAGGGGGRGGAGGGGRGAAANVERCGEQAAPGSFTGTPGGIEHDDETETYIVVSGAGTLVTGGHIVNGVKSGPDSEVTKILNGPSCSGTMVGDTLSRNLTVGDIVIIPYGVPHGWSNIPDHVDYLSVRPDPDHVLQTGYVNPAIKK